nr:polyprenyl synthetase family protein [Syntrophomonas palmitatica]
MDEVLDYLLESGGKMLRPRMVFQVASLYSHDINTVIDIAAAVELIHLASLIHDDVIDQAATRRGRASVNKRFSNQVSVLTGDYLFASAFKIIDQRQVPGVMGEITSTIQLMCAGEIKQLGLLYHLDLSEEDYYEKIYRKTACLFASSCKVGALAAGAPTKEIELLSLFGACLGYAYQIIDDVLDFVADSQQLGKPAVSDLLQGNITLPVILALKDAHYGPKLRQILNEGGFGRENFSQVMEILVETKSLQQSIITSRFYLQYGMAYLDELPPYKGLDKLRESALYLINSYFKNLTQLEHESGKIILENSG